MWARRGRCASAVGAIFGAAKTECLDMYPLVLREHRVCECRVLRERASRKLQLLHLD